MPRIDRTSAFAAQILARWLLRHGSGCRLSWQARFISPRRIELGKEVTVREYSLIAAEGQHVRLGNHCYVDRNVLISAHGGWIEAGPQCSFNPNCVIYGHGGLRLGRGVRIAAGTVIIPANHGFDDVHRPIHDQPISKRGIVIEDDVWIGANCVITDGVHIGKGTVIGAGSVVTQDLPAMSVAVGSPARVIRQRGDVAVATSS